MAKHHIKICLGSSCFSRGNRANLAVIKDYVSVKNIEADVTFTGQLCEEMCSCGPVVIIDDKVYEQVNVSKLYKILEEQLRC